MWMNVDCVKMNRHHACDVNMMSETVSGACCGSDRRTVGEVCVTCDGLHANSSRARMGSL